MVRNDLRNVAIIAHVDHGKTTLVDAMLRQSGAFRDNQVVAERVMDSGDIERERGITILAKNCSCTYKGVKINIVDTPGHADFGGEVERVLKMVNGVLLLVDAAEGCMPQTRFVLQKALQQNLSLVVAINKIDRPDARIKEVIDEVLYLLMDLGATDEQLDCPMLFCCGRDGTASLDPDVPGTDLIPLFDTLLSTIKPPEGDPEAPFQMLVSSVDYNDFVGRIGIGRIQNGVAKVGEEVVVCDWHNQDLKMRGRLTKLYDFQANGRQPCDNITAGDIGAVTKLTATQTGDTLCDAERVVKLPAPVFPKPSLFMAVTVAKKGDEGKISSALARLMEEDPTLSYENNAETHQQVIGGLGEQHLDVVKAKLKNKFGVEIGLEAPRIAYRESIRKACQKQGRHKKQTGGHGQFGDVIINFEPCDSEQVVFEEKVFGGSVPKNFFPAVEKGVRLAAEKGVLAGYPVVGLKATLLDGSYHPVDSSEMAFIMAAKLAYKAAMPEAGPVILEPIHTLKAHVPNDNTGDIMGDVTKRRGRVLGMEPDEDGLQTIIAEVPLAELANFTTFIRQTTQGRGWFTTEFARYEILPEMLVPAVVEQAKKLGNLDEGAED